MVSLNSNELDASKIAHEVWRNKRSIIGSTLAITVATFISVSLMKPKYTSEARVLVESRENVFLRPTADKPQIERSSPDQQAMLSQVQLVLSRDLAREIIEKLSLSERSEFNSLPKGFTLMTIPRLLGLVPDPRSMSEQERVLGAYYSRLSAKLIEKSRVIAIEFQSADPELAAHVANAVAERYLTVQQRVRQDQALSAGQWLSGEIEKLRNKVAAAEAAVEAFRAQSDIFVGTKDITLTTQQLTELSAQLSSARAKKADAETRARMLRDQLGSGRPFEASDVTGSELIRRLSEQRITLRAQLAEQSSTLMPQHPRIKQMEAQIYDLDQQIQSEAERLVRSLENDAGVAVARLEALTTTLDQRKREIASTSDQDVQLRALEREAKAHRDTFEAYLAKYSEAIARGGIAAAPSEARVISPAVISTLPSSPNKMPIMLITALGTLCVSSIFVASRVAFGSAGHIAPKRQTAAIERANLASDSRLRIGTAKRALRDPPPFAATSRAPAEACISTIDDIVGALRQASQNERRVAVIGGGREVDTSPTAIAIARSLARSARVVLVDLAARTRSVDYLSNNPSAPGIADLVRGTASFGDIITRDRFSNLHVVGLGLVDGDPTELLSSRIMLSAIDALGQSYDYLVINTGASSGANFAPYNQMAGRAVLVAGETPQPLLRDFLPFTSASFAEVAVSAGALTRLDRAMERSRVA